MAGRMTQNLERMRQGIIEAQKQRDDAQRELESLFRRRAELRKRRAPKEMLRRYDLEIVEIERRVNELGDIIFAAQNRLTGMALAKSDGGFGNGRAAD